jgi:hypothetical protein
MSVHPHGTTRLSSKGFSRNLILIYFRKYGGTIKVSLKPYKKTGYCTGRHSHIYVNISQNERCFRQGCR